MFSSWLDVCFNLHYNVAQTHRSSKSWSSLDLVVRAVCSRSSQPKPRLDFVKLTDLPYKSHFVTCKSYMSGSLRRRNCFKLFVICYLASFWYFKIILWMLLQWWTNERLAENMLELFVMSAHWFLLFLVLVVVIGQLHLISIPLVEDLPFFLPL